MDSEEQCRKSKTLIINLSIVVGTQNISAKSLIKMIPNYNYQSTWQKRSLYGYRNLTRNFNTKTKFPPLEKLKLTLQHHYIILYLWLTNSGSCISWIKPLPSQAWITIAWHFWVHSKPSHGISMRIIKAGSTDASMTPWLPPEAQHTLSPVMRYEVTLNPQRSVA